MQVAEVRAPGELADAFAMMVRTRVDALTVLPSRIFSSSTQRIVDLAAQSRLPAVYSIGEFTDAGGLMSYATDFRAAFDHAAVHIDRILKGAKPGDLPIEQPTKFELAINLKTAKALGITIPQSILLRADRVIE